MPIKSDFPNVQIDERQFAFQFMEQLATHANDAKKVAIVSADYPDERLTYRNLRLYITALTDFLHEHEFGKNSVACIVSPNCAQFAIVFGAVVMCGGALSGASNLFIEDELRAQFNDCGASILFCHESVLERVRTAWNGCSKIRFLIVMTDTNKEISLKNNEYQMTNLFKRNTASKDRKLPMINVREDALLLPYSSGTTGLPKGVIITHHNLSAVCSSYDFVMRKVVWPRGCRNYEPHRESLILIPPFYHVYGIFTLIKALMDGTQVVLMKQFNGEMFCSLVQKYKVKMQMMVPPLLSFLVAHPIVQKFDLSSITLIISAAAPLSSELASEVRKRLPNVRYIAQAFGMTELTAVSHYPHLVDAPMKAGAVGKLGPCLELKVVCPETGEELRLDKMGEICIKGPVVMRGYLHNEEATKETIDVHGFLHTGDLGYVDSHHRVLHVVDRLKELIKVSGRQVAPAELENILLAHSLVTDCAVVGVEDEKCGELPKAFVVLKPDQKPTDPTSLANDLCKFVAERVAPFKQLKGGIEFCLSIPKSPAGKVLRRELKKRLKN